METPDSHPPHDAYRQWALAHAQEGFRAVPWRWYDGLIAIGVILPTQLMVNFLPDLPQDLKLWIAHLPFWVLWLVIYLFPILWRLVYPLVMARLRLSSFRVRIPPARVWLRESLVALSIVTAICVVIGVAVAVATLAANQGIQVPSVWGGTSEASVPSLLTILLLISAMVVAPATEEIFFRGLVYNWLKRFCPMWLALLLQAEVFALFHPFQLTQFLIVFAIALVLGAVYEWRKTLLTPILIHMMRNVVASVAVAMLGQA